MKAARLSISASAGACGLAAMLACSPALADKDDGSLWTFVRGVTGQDTAKPAEVIHTRADGVSNTLTNAALLYRASPPPKFDSYAMAWGVSLGFSKNTLAKKPSETLTGGGNLRAIVGLPGNDYNNLKLNADYLFTDDRQHHARGQSLVIDAALDTLAQHILDPDLNAGQEGMDAWVFPNFGLFKHRVTSTSSPTDTPEGSHGGTYAGLTFNSRVLFLSKDYDLLQRFSLVASYVYARESSVSGGYAKANYRFGTVSLNYLLSGDTSAKGWKPMISFTRSKGTDRVHNQPRVDQSEIAFKISYGIK